MIDLWWWSLKWFPWKRFKSQTNKQFEDAPADIFWGDFEDFKTWLLHNAHHKHKIFWAEVCEQDYWRGMCGKDLLRDKEWLSQPLRPTAINFLEKKHRAGKMENLSTDDTIMVWRQSVWFCLVEEPTPQCAAKKMLWINVGVGKGKFALCFGGFMFFWTSRECDLSFPPRIAEATNFPCIASFFVTIFFWEHSCTNS